MTELRGHGLALSIERGWEGRIFVPQEPPPAENHPIVRLANFALPTTADTYAEDVADSLRPGQLIASLVEFSARLADRGLYAPQGVPAFGVDDLDPRALQRHLPGRFGLQRFFSVRGRAFSLYVIARDGHGLAASLRSLQAQVRGVVVSAG
jgi:hypothetical protein